VSSDARCARAKAEASSVIKRGYLGTPYISVIYCIYFCNSDSLSLSLSIYIYTKYYNIYIYNNIHIFWVNYNSEIGQVGGWFPSLTMVPVTSQWGLP
jgi:hypothetical protein